MRKAEKTTTDIRIARAGETTKVVPFKDNMTVAEALNQANISLSSSEEVYVESDSAGMDDVLEAGDLIQVVGKKEGGSF